MTLTASVLTVEGAQNELFHTVVGPLSMDEPVDRITNTPPHRWLILDDRLLGLVQLDPLTNRDPQLTLDALRRGLTALAIDVAATATGAVREPLEEEPSKGGTCLHMVCGKEEVIAATDQAVEQFLERLVVPTLGSPPTGWQSVAAWLGSGALSSGVVAAINGVGVPSPTLVVLGVVSTVVLRISAAPAAAVSRGLAYKIDKAFGTPQEYIPSAKPPALTTPPTAPPTAS
jgi:hypothetical protein